MRGRLRPMQTRCSNQLGPPRCSWPALQPCHSFNLASTLAPCSAKALSKYSDMVDTLVRSQVGRALAWLCALLQRLHDLLRGAR